MEDLFLRHSLNKEDIKDCKIKEMQSGDLLICLSARPTCPHFLKFGNEKFCQHDLIKEIVKQRHADIYQTG
jgi:hypothetical protein